MEAVTEVDLLDATLWNRIGYLFEEMTPTVKLQDGEGEAAAVDMPLGLNLLFSYNERINRNDGNSSSVNPISIVRGFVTDKVTNDELPGDDVALVEDGGAASLHSHSPIYIPGTRLRRRRSSMTYLFCPRVNCDSWILDLPAAAMGSHER